MIFLSELDEIDREGIANLVTPYLLHSTVGIVVPKSGSVFSVSRENLLTEYGTAAYVGQKLGEYAPDTTYDYATLQESGDFEFVVPLGNHADFIDLLLTLSYGFGNGDDESWLTFWGEVETFIDDVEQERVEAFCPRLVNIYHELTMSLEDEEEFEDDDD